MEDGSSLLPFATFIVALGTLVAALFGIAPVRSEALKRWRRLQRWWRRHMGNRKRRATAIAMWRVAPEKLLDRTVFRWFQKDPQAWWLDVKRVYDHNDDLTVKQAAYELLWRTKPAETLKLGERFRSGGHVVGIVEQGPDLTKVVTGPGRTTTWRRGGMAEVTNGWCDLEPDCPVCALGRQ